MNMIENEIIVQRKRKKIYELLKDLNEEDFNFNFSGYCRSFESDENKDKVYQMADKNLNERMDITQYL